VLARREDFLSLCGDVLEFLAGCLKNGLQSAYRTETTQAHIAVKRIELDCKSAPACPLGANESRPRTAKWIEHDALTLRAVSNGVFDHRDRLHGWMKLQVRAGFTEAVDASERALCLHGQRRRYPRQNRCKWRRQSGASTVGLTSTMDMAGSSIETRCRRERLGILILAILGSCFALKASPCARNFLLHIDLFSERPTNE
jgi:hypothetical protein